jgi:hypothetical protein
VTPWPAQPILGIEASARCRDQLSDAGLTTADELAVWAQRVLPTKNTLRNDDATVVERAFTTKLEQLTHAAETADGSKREPARNGAASTPIAQREDVTRPAAADSASANSEGAVPASESADLAFGKTRRKRNTDHRAFVASNTCLVCGRQPADAHHIRFAQPPALGRKVSDEFTVPLCRIHHRELHMRGDEAAWWAQYPVDPLRVARELWERSHAERASPTADEGSQIASAATPNVVRNASEPTAK